MGENPTAEIPAQPAESTPPNPNQENGSTPQPDNPAFQAMEDPNTTPEDILEKLAVMPAFADTQSDAQQSKFRSPNTHALLTTNENYDPNAPLQKKEIKQQQKQEKHARKEAMKKNKESTEAFKLAEEDPENAERHTQKAIELAKQAAHEFAEAQRHSAYRQIATGEQRLQTKEELLIPDADETIGFVPDDEYYQYEQTQREAQRKKVENKADQNPPVTEEPNDDQAEPQTANSEEEGLQEPEGQTASTQAPEPRKREGIKTRLSKRLAEWLKSGSPDVSPESRLEDGASANTVQQKPEEENEDASPAQAKPEEDAAEESPSTPALTNQPAQ